MTTITPDFVNDIKQWVALDDQLKQTQKLMSQIKKQKEQVGYEISGYMEQNGLQDKDINLSDGKIKYYTSKQVSGMTRKYIENCLGSYFKGDLNKARDATDYLYSNRETVEKIALKRTKKLLQLFTFISVGKNLFKLNLKKRYSKRLH